jgi:pimeloyl-ACP methyl ester carboxylesterase
VTLLHIAGKIAQYIEGERLMDRRTISENGLVADLFHDGSGQPRRAIIMFGGSEGGKSWSRRGLRQPLNYLLKQGYCVLSLAYFKAPGLPRTLEEVPLEYFAMAFSWLQTQPEVLPDGVALIGGSKGAEAALLLGSRYPQVRAVVALSPSSVVWQGIPSNRFDLGKGSKSSWSYAGEGLPFVPYVRAAGDTASLLMLRLRKLHEEALENTASVAEAAIPVEKTRAAILLVSGKRDQLWPSTSMCEQVMRRLAENGFEHPSQHIAYDTGHNGLVMKRDCWRAIFNFLEENFA